MDLPSILVPYRLSLDVHSPRLPDIGSYMKCMGHLFRHFNDSVPDYDDSFVLKFIVDRGEDLSYYDKFAVVPQVREHARKALSRYDRCENPFSKRVEALYDIAGSWLDLEFGPHLEGSRIVSNDAVEQHLRDDKSSGAPWNLVGVRTKGEFFETKSEFYALYWDALATENHIRSLCSSSIKEELRDSEKVLNGQVRTIISMDVCHVKAHCQLTLDQNERLMFTIGKHSSSLGIVMQHGGWDKLNTRMSAHGPLPCTLELDARQFDSRFRYIPFQKIRDFRFRMLASEFRTSANWARMCNLYWELCFAPFVDVDGNVYSRESGNPSGQACTTPDNIFKNFMDIVVLWHLIMPESYHNYRDFHRLLILCIVGDDINISVHPSIQHLFNAEKIFAAMHDIDMEYTTPCMKFRHNYDCEFLSHGFEDMLGIYVPIIDCQKMRTSMLRFNQTGEMYETIARACGLRNETFACIHCREWFRDLIVALRRECGDSTDENIVREWKAYKTDAELWSLYTGLKYSDVCIALASATRSPEYKLAHSNISKLSNRIIRKLQNSHSLSPELQDMSNNQKVKVTTTTTKKKKSRFIGPLTKKSTEKRARKQARKAASKRGGNRRSGPSKSLPTHIDAGQAARMYVAHLSDPFNVPPVHTGAGGMPCHIWGSYCSAVLSGTTFSDLLVQMVPGAIAAGTTANVYQTVTPATVWSAGTVTGVLWNNITAAGNIISDARPVSAAVRASVRFPSVTTPPIMYAGRMPANGPNDTDLVGQTSASLFSSPLTTKGGGACTSFQSNWVPQDAYELSFFDPGYRTSTTGSTTNPFVCFTGKTTTDTCTIVVEFIQFFMIQSNTIAQLAYYFNSPQPTYTPSLFWNEYIKLANSGKGAVALVENFEGVGHKHGSQHGFGSTSDSKSSSSTEVKAAAVGPNEVVNPIGQPIHTGSGVVTTGGSSTLSVIGAIGTAAMGHAVRKLVGHDEYYQQDIENQRHFAPAAALVEQKTPSGASAPIIGDQSETDSDFDKDVDEKDHPLSSSTMNLAQAIHGLVLGRKAK